jgi:hypothetical protein
VSETTELLIPETMHIDTPVEEPPARSPDAPPHLSKREEQMIAIAERRREAIERELAYGVTMENEARATGGGDPVPDEDADTSAGADVPPSPPPAATATGASAPAPPASGPAPAEPETRRHVVNVGGQQFVVNDQELAHLASLGATTQIALNQHQQAQYRAPESVQQSAPQPSPARTIDPELTRNVVRRINYGNEDEAAAALLEFAQQIAPAPQQIDLRGWTEQAKAEWRAEQALQHNLMTVGREYEDVFGPMDRPVSDPAEQRRYQRAAQLAALALHDIRTRDYALGRARSDLEVYREAAAEVRATIGSRQPLQSGQEIAPQAALQAAVPASQSERLTRKRAAPSLPSAVSRVASGGDAPSRAPTGSEIVAQMARQRNQQTPVRL